MSVDSRAPDVYDPLTVFLNVWSKPLSASDLGGRTTCYEVNTLAALLRDHALPDAADLWKAAHDRICLDPDGH